MTLNPHPDHPSAGCYVLKLHRDAAPRRGRLCGRLEHVASGELVDFANADALLAWLVQHAARTLAPPSGAAVAASSAPTAAAASAPPSAVAGRVAATDHSGSAA